MTFVFGNRDIAPIYTCHADHAFLDHKNMFCFVFAFVRNYHNSITDRQRTPPRERVAAGDTEKSVQDDE